MNMQGATARTAKPVRVGALLAQALNLGDVESAARCFARDGCLITPDATAIHGRERIRPLLAQLVARRPLIEVELSDTIAAGDVVLAQERWRVRSHAGEGSTVEQTWDPTLLLRRVEQHWRLAIAAPWGWGRTYP